MIDIILTVLIFHLPHLVRVEASVEERVGASVEEGKDVEDGDWRLLIDGLMIETRAPGSWKTARP